MAMQFVSEIQYINLTVLSARTIAPDTPERQGKEKIQKYNKEEQEVLSIQSPPYI